MGGKGGERKKRNNAKQSTVTLDIVLADGGSSDERTWRVCSDNEVSVRKELDHESDRVRYVNAGEEFQAAGPYQVSKGLQRRVEWLKISDEGGGFVCTTSSNDPSKVVAVLKRKQTGADGQDTKPDLALLIKPEWCAEILDNGKVWEIRGSYCHKRTRFAIAKSGTQTLVGEATLVNCLNV